MHDPHLQTRNIIIEGRHPRRSVTYIGEAAKVDGEEYVVRHPAPLPGEHPRDMLVAELELTDAELGDLSTTRVIATS